MNEAEWLTRKKRIDSKLRSLNWQIARYKDGMDFSALTHHAVEKFPTAHGFADYALFVDGKLLGFIEAKKVTVNPQNVLEQSKRYSKTTFHGVGNWNGYRTPFLYATNGEVIWFADVRTDKYLSRQISRFHTSKALSKMFSKDNQTSFDWLLQNKPEQIERLRKYQREDAGPGGRFRRFHISEIKDRDYKLDITWLKDESPEDADELPEPQDLAAEAITELEAVVDDLREIVALIEKEEMIVAKV